MKGYRIACLLMLGLSPNAGAEQVDLDIVERIKEQAFNHSQVMDYVHYLADENGARLAASPSYQRAAHWAVATLEEAGTRAWIEEFGAFGRSWAWSRVAVQMLEPEVTTLNGVPLAWSAGTNGVVRAPVIFAPLWADPNDPGAFDLVKLAEQIEAYKKRYSGKLAGKIVLLSGERPFVLPSKPDIQRWSDADLADMTTPREPPDYDPRAWPLLRQPTHQAERWISYEFVPVEIEHDYSEREMRLLDRLIRFLNAERVAAVLMTNTEGNGGVIFAESFGSYESTAPVPPPAVQLMPEHYNRLVRLVGRGMAVVLSVDVDAEFPEQEATLMNVIAELPGKNKPEEIVMMGAHLDSWHAGTGATDNATGCAVVLEAMRILQALDVKLDRTVRLGLWDAEEHGHYGSRAYVSRYFGDPVSMKLKPAHKTFSAYFNIDTGSGKTRGILTQRIPGAKPIFESLVQPFAELGVTTVVPRKDFQTDHESFDAVGLPAFDLLQDQLDYWSHTHHSNVDTVDHVVPDDLKTSAAFLATLVYHAATRADMMPRDALPLPLPPPQALPDILQKNYGTQELQEFASRYAAAWSNRDPVAFAAFYADNGSLAINDGAPSVGRGAIAQMAREFMQAFPDMLVRLVSVRREGANVIFEWHWTGTNTGPGGTGNAVDLKGYEVWTLDVDGRILQSHGHMDDAEYQRQLHGRAE